MGYSLWGCKELDTHAHMNLKKWSVFSKNKFKNIKAWAHFDVCLTTSLSL